MKRIFLTKSLSKEEKQEKLRQKRKRIFPFLLLSVGGKKESEDSEEGCLFIFFLFFPFWLRLMDWDKTPRGTKKELLLERKGGLII